MYVFLFLNFLQIQTYKYQNVPITIIFWHQFLAIFSSVSNEHVVQVCDGVHCSFACWCTHVVTVLSPRAPHGEPRAARGDQFIKQETKFYPFLL